MSEVLLDNWGLSECVRRKFRGEDRYGSYRLMNRHNEELCWQNFLTSIILWDDIYVNSHHGLWKMSDTNDIGVDDYAYSFDSLTNMAKRWLNTNFLNLSFVHIAKESFEIEKLSEKLEISGVLDTLKVPAFYKLNYKHKSLLVSGYRYVLQANELGYNYLPHPERAKFLLKSGVFTKGFNRQEYIKILDKEVEKYMEEVNNLCGNNLLDTKFPVLYEFIAKETSSPQEQFKYAIELRNNKDVVKFRESVNQIEELLQNGNILELKKSLDCTKKICDDITTDLYKKPLSFSVSLGLSPSINITLNPKNNRTKSILHTTFLYDITKFAVSGQKHHRYKLDGLNK